MIIILPMITSGSISPNVLPGLMKAVEKYAIIYGMDSILRDANAALSKSVQLAGTTMQILGKSRIVMKGGKLEEQGQRGTDPTKVVQGLATSLGKDLSGEKAKGISSLKVDTAGYNALSLEPTWVQVTTPKSGLQILGIKAIPFPVQSPEGLVRSLLADKASIAGDYITKKYSRMMMRIMYRLARKIRIPTLKDKVLTGDPKTDILWASTLYKNNLIVAFNQMELENVNIFSDPKTVQKLHKLGWSSFIIADDVNKRATFCMKEFGGVCSTVLYAYLFSSLGKDHNKVYEDLEDLRRSSGPFFRMTTNKRKVFGEAVAKNKFNQFSSSMESLLEQGIDKLMKKNPIALTKQLANAKKAIDNNDSEGLKAAVQGIPAVPLPKVEKFCRKFSAKFQNNYELSKRVIGNSLDFDDKLTKYTSCILAIGSVTQNPMDPDYATKRNLKMYINHARKYSMEGSIQWMGTMLLASFLVALGKSVKMAKGVDWFVAGIKVLYKATPKPLLIAMIIAIVLIFLLWISKED